MFLQHSWIASPCPLRGLDDHVIFKTVLISFVRRALLPIYAQPVAREEPKFTHIIRYFWARSFVLSDRLL